MFSNPRKNLKTANVFTPLEFIERVTDSFHVPPAIGWLAGQGVLNLEDYFAPYMESLDGISTPLHLRFVLDAAGNARLFYKATCLDEKWHGDHDSSQIGLRVFTESPSGVPSVWKPTVRPDSKQRAALSLCASHIQHQPTRAYLERFAETGDFGFSPVDVSTSAVTLGRPAVLHIGDVCSREICLMDQAPLLLFQLPKRSATPASTAAVVVSVSSGTSSSARLSSTGASDSPCILSSGTFSLTALLRCFSR